MARQLHNNLKYDRRCGQETGMNRIKGAIKSLVYGAGLGLLLAGPLSCNQHPLYRNPPNFRGVTVPLPPPSFATMPVLPIEIEVIIPWDHVGPGTIVYLYESTTDRGYFAYGRQATARFSEIEVDSRNNCLTTYYEEGESGQESAIGFSKVVLIEDIAQCTSDPSCSVLDGDQKACLCISYRSTGC